MAAVIAIVFPVCRACAAEPEKSPREEAAAKFRILDQQEVVLDSRSIIYNRVVAPQPKTSLPPAASQRNSAPPATVSEPAAGAERKRFQTISPFVTVYDGRFSEMRWQDEKGSLRIVSNIDMNHFGASGTFQTTDTVFSYLLFLSNGSLADLADTRDVDKARSTLADLVTNPQARAGYIITEGQPADHPEAVAAFDAMHSFYNVHREQLIRDHQAHEAAERERQRQLREHPPAPKDTVINYWPKKNSIYLNENH